MPRHLNAPGWARVPVAAAGLAALALLPATPATAAPTAQQAPTASGILTGHVPLGTTFAPRTAVVGVAQVTLRGVVLPRGRARSVMTVRSRRGTRLEAGVVRTGGGSLRWAVWARRPNGARYAVAVSSARVTPGAPARLALVTRWGSRKGGAVLRVNASPVAQTPRLNLTGVTAVAMRAGLGAPGRGEAGTATVRYAQAWGRPRARGVTTPTPSPTPSPAPTPTPTPTEPPPNPGTPATPGRIPGTVFASVDFESGSYGGRRYFGGISSYQAVASDRIQSVPTPGGTGRAGRFELRQGDSPVSCCGDRAEVSVDTNETEGQERWYSWATMFDQSFPSAHAAYDYQVVSQFHSQHNGQPPVAFYAEGGVYRLQVWPKNSDGSSARGPVTIWSTPIQRGRWYRIALHVKWSGRDDVGFVELFVDGQPAGRRTQIRTMYPGYRNYFKMGYYRDSDVSPTGVVYHDDFLATNVN